MEKGQVQERRQEQGVQEEEVPWSCYVGEEWDSEDESSSSEEEGVANIAIQTAPPTPCLFTNLTDNESDHIPTCLMAKGKKVSTETPPSSDNDESSTRENMIRELG